MAEVVSCGLQISVSASGHLVFALPFLSTHYQVVIAVFYFLTSAFAHGRNEPVDNFISNLDTFFKIHDAIACTLQLMGILSYIVCFCTFGLVLLYSLV